MDSVKALPLRLESIEAGAVSVRTLTRGMTLRTLHVTMLGVATLILLLAALLQVREDQLVEFRFAPGHPFPEVCTMKRVLHADCPGCGLTRSFVHLMHGDVSSSQHVHPFGWMLFLLTLAQFPYRLWAMRSPHRAPFGHLVPWTPLLGIMVLVWSRWLLLALS